MTGPADNSHATGSRAARLAQCVCDDEAAHVMGLCPIHQPAEMTDDVSTPDPRYVPTGGAKCAECGKPATIHCPPCGKDLCDECEGWAH